LWKASGTDKPTVASKTAGPRPEELMKAAKN